VRGVRWTAGTHRRRVSTSVVDRSVWNDIDARHGGRQRQLSMDDADAPWTANQPHPDELQSAGVVSNFTLWQCLTF